MLQTVTHRFLKNHHDVPVIVAGKFYVSGFAQQIFIGKTNAGILEYINTQTLKALPDFLYQITFRIQGPKDVSCALIKTAYVFLDHMNDPFFLFMPVTQF